MEDSLFSKAVKSKDGDYFEIDITDLGIDYKDMKTEEFLSLFYHAQDPETILIKSNDQTADGLVSRRYFADTLVCFECGLSGHANRNCPQTQVSVCVLCAKKGHTKISCPMVICNFCYMCGHRSNDCMNKDQKRFVMCRKCRSGEHSVRDCPAVWREYLVLPNYRGNPYEDNSCRNIKKGCPICFSDDHFVDDCKKNYKTKFSIFNSDFMSIVRLYKK